MKRSSLASVTRLARRDSSSKACACSSYARARIRLAGELCAYRKPPEAATAAAEAAERRAGRGTALSQPAGGGLAYCRVINDSRPPPGVPMYRVTVEVWLQ